MKLKAQIEDREQELLIKVPNVEAGRVAAEIGERVYDLAVRQTNNWPWPDNYVFLLGTNVYECRVSERVASKNVFEVDIRGRNYTVTIVDPKRLSSGQNSDRHHHGVAEIRAPMPGKVVRVLIEAGVNAEKGAGVVVVEAMKMQNEMKSPRDGLVVSVNVKAGDTVNAGDVLAVIE